MQIQAIAFGVIGGLGLFLYGMRAMSDGLQSLAGDSLRRIIGALTNNRVIAVMVGFLVTTIIQSSSVTTVMVVGFVNSGLMTLTQAIGVILGANIGTTITGWIIAIKITKYALPILGVGVGFYFFSRARSLKDFGHILFGIGMIFLGLQVMKSGLSDLKNDPGFVQWFSHFDAATFSSLLGAIAVGCLLTMVVQSSSATLGITIALASTGLINFQTSAALILGENIGTTLTAQIASIGTNPNARRAARAHLLFNCFGVLVIVAIFRPYVNFIDWLIPFPANFLTPEGNAPYITVHIAATHSLFNVINVLLFLPFIQYLARFVTWMVPGQEEQVLLPHHLEALDDRLLESPAIAIEQARQEILKMGEIVVKILLSIKDLFKDLKPNNGLWEEIFKKEKITDEIQKEVTIFLSKVMEANLTLEQSFEVRSLIRVADEIESVADYCESLAKYHRRCLTDKIKFSNQAIGEIAKMENLIDDYYQKSLKAFESGNRDYLNQAKVNGQGINDYADSVREAHLNRLNKKECSPMASLIFSDIMVAFRRIKNHTFNIAEAAAGIK